MPMLLKRPSGDCKAAGAHSGVTLIELIAASVVVALLAAATLMAFLTAARMSSQSNQNAEAAYLLQQTIERFRNEVACDNPGWFGANCASVASFTQPDPSPGFPDRKVQVAAQDCDGDGTNDCFQVTTSVHWDPPQ